MAVRHYRELVAWQRAMDLSEAIYRVTSQFPRDDRFGLTNQLRRASVSVPSNIAEGQGRGVGAEFARFLRIANGSRQEVETQVLLPGRFGYINEAVVVEVLSLADEVGRVLTGLLNSVTGN